MEPRLERALGKVAAWLEQRDVPYAVWGSALLDLLGLRVEVGDLDLVFPTEAHPVLQRAPWWRLPTRPRRPPFDSDWVERFEVSGVSVECIGGLRVEIEGRLVEVPHRGGGTAWVQGRPVPLAPPGAWYHVYRAHRPEEAAALGAVIGEAAVAAAAAVLGLAARSGLAQGSPYNGNDAGCPIVGPEAMTDTMHAVDAVESAQVDLDALTDALDYIRPALQADGGDAILLGVEGGRVTLQLVGACGGCPMATITLTAGIERILCDRVPGVTEVVAL